jgi:tetratricopeptide (TPR) repeat protein
MLTARSAAALSIVVCAMIVASCGGAQSRLESHMRRGQAYFSQGDFAKANVEFRNATQIAPKDPAARLMVAHTAEHLGQFGPAIGLYQSVVDSNPENVDARVSLGRLLTIAGAPQRGLDVVQPGLKQHPDDPELLTVQAAAKSGLNDQAGAVADIDRALKLAPTNENAVAVRANLYRRAGDYAGAITLVSRAVGQLPKSASLHEVLVSLYASAEQPAKAEEQLRALIDLKPAELRYRNQLAALYARDNRLDDAQRVLEETVKAFPKSDPAKLALVDFLSTARSSAEGEKVLQGFIAREPDDYDLRLHLAALLEASRKTKEAIAVYDEVVRRAGTEPMGLIARNKIAAIDVAQQRYEDAGKLISQVLQKNPRDDDALRLRGQVSLERHDPVAAIADFRAVLRDQPKAVGIQRLLAQAHLENGESELAAEVLRSAQQSAPADSALRIELAQLLLKMRRGDESVKLLEEGVRSAPANADLRESLVRAYIAAGNYVAAGTGAEGLKTLRPTAATGSFLAGLAAQGENKLDEAQKEFDHALALQPRSVEVLSALARLELARKHPEQAITLVKNAAEHDSNAYSWNLLGELYLAQKDTPSATDALSRASKLSPTWWVPYRNLALANLVANDAPGAIAQYEQAIKTAPSESGLVIELASLLEKQGRVDDAIRRYEASYAATRNRMIANNLAMLLVTYKKDRTSLDRARDLTRGFDTSTEGDLLDTNGWVHFKRAEYADALPPLERAAQRVPDSRVIHYHLGMAELQAGRTDRARADLQTAVSGSATFPGLDEARTALATLKSET